MPKAQRKVSEIIEGFKKLIPTSKNLAKDAENLCDELSQVDVAKTNETIGSLMADVKESEGRIRELEQALFEGRAARETLQEILEEIICREPDATLREKLRELVQELSFDTGLDKHKVLIALSLPPVQ